MQKNVTQKNNMSPKRQKIGIEGHRKYKWTVCRAGKRPAGRQRMSIQSDVPHPPPERKVNENGGLGGDGEVVRIISGIIWEVLMGCGYWFRWRFFALLVSLLSCIYKWLSSILVGVVTVKSFFGWGRPDGSLCFCIVLVSLKRAIWGPERSAASTVVSLFPDEFPPNSRLRFLENRLWYTQT